jgi:hypothetical protein
MADASLDDLRRRIRRLEDIEAIRAVKHRYLNACDQQQPERAASCFAEGEVEIDMGHVGVLKRREEFAQLYRAAGCHPHILDMHQGGNAEIEFVDDDHAKALWSLDYRNINTQEKTVTFLCVKYHDEYARAGGEWKITKSRSEFKQALHCSYASGKLESLLAAKSVAGVVEYPKE